jgi:hypothetical protein
MSLGCGRCLAASSVPVMEAEHAARRKRFQLGNRSGPPHLLMRSPDECRRKHRQEWPPRGGLLPSAPSSIQLPVQPAVVALCCRSQQRKLRYVAPKRPELTPWQIGLDRLLRPAWSTDLWKALRGQSRNAQKPEGGRSDLAASSGFVLSEIADASGGSGALVLAGGTRARRLNQLGLFGAFFERRPASPHETWKRPEFLQAVAREDLSGSVHFLGP